MNIDQYKTISLSHRNAFGVKGNSNGTSWLVASPDGTYSIFNANGDVSRHTLRQEIAGIDFLPQREIIALYTNNKLTVQTVNGNIIFQKQGRYLESYFSEIGECLWTVLYMDGDTVLIEVLDTFNGSLIAAITIEDEYTDSAYSFSPGSHFRQMVLYMAAGQDGQSTLFVELEQNALSIIKLEIENTTPAVFNHRGDIFLQSEDEALLVLNYPGRELLKTIPYPDDFGTCYYLGFIDESRVVLAGYNIPSVIDISNRQIRSILIKGHEPKPLNYYYPNLMDEDEKTDIEGVDIFGSNLLFHCCTHREDPLKQNSILIVDAKEII